MSYLESIFLGVLQGFSEFLPISSSAHLVIAPWVFGFSDPGLTFDVALHGGTLLAILFYFWRDWLDIFKGSYQSLFSSKAPHTSEAQKDKGNLNLLIYLIIATLPGAVAGYFLDDYAEATLRHPLLIAADMSVLGFFLLLADVKCKGGKGLQQVSFRDSILIGVSQALALIPGVSRSGITMTMGLFLGLSRETAARFSFLLATPIMVGAFVFKLKPLFENGLDGQGIAGIVASAVVGFLSIKYLLKYVRTHNYRPFVYYRFGFTVFVLIRYFV